MKHKYTTRKMMALILAACLLLGLGITAYAYGAQIVQTFFGWGNNMEIHQLADTDGNTSCEVYVHTDNLSEPVVIQNDRLYFVVNDETIDITDLISQTQAFCYEYQDSDGNTHFWLVGSLSEAVTDYGYAEYIHDPEGIWIGGYSARINIEPDGTTSAQWLEQAKKDYQIPW